MYDSVVKLSAYYDQNVSQYLESKGFNMVASRPSYRLSKAKQDNDDALFNYICNVRKAFIDKSDVFNNENSTQDDISKEIDVIAYNVLECIKMSKKSVKR